jgi:transcriptional regulator with XRE-family HTH domain
LKLTKQKLSEKVGYNIRKARKAKAHTIKGLAYEADIEYTQLSRIERGKINTSVYQIYLIAMALKVEYVSLFEGI